jgi:Spy/CpxP family protein refolding chaperone
MVSKELVFYNSPCRRQDNYPASKIKTHMKRMIVSALALSLVTGMQAQETGKTIPGMEQGGKGFHHRGMHGMDMSQLNLTDNQKAQFKTQQESFRQQMEALKKNDGITVKEWRNQMQFLRKQNHEKLQGLLTSEQKTKMEKMKMDARAHREAMGKERSARMKTNLGLTDEQSAKWEKNRADFGSKMKAIHDDKSLTDDQRMEQFKSLRKEQKESMKSILTPDQMKKLHEGKHGHHERPKKIV